MEDNWNLLQSNLTRCPPGWGMARECALFYRVYYILGGEAWCKIDGVTFALARGTLYILPVRKPYDLWQNRENPLEVLWFHAQLSEELFPELVQLQIREDTALFHVLQALKLASGAAVKALAGALLDLAREETTLRVSKDPRLRAVDAWIATHLDQEIRVEQLAAQAGLERSYFSREFHRVMQISPQQYILAQKMSAAAQALQHGASVGQAAAKAGYLSEKAFSRAFRTYMEITPRDYKKSHIMQP